MDAVPIKGCYIILNFRVGYSHKLHQHSVKNVWSIMSLWTWYAPTNVTINHSEWALHLIPLITFKDIPNLTDQCLLLQFPS